MPRQAVNEREREVGERADVEIDHAELLVARKPGGAADQTETGVVDDGLRLKPAGRQRLADPRGRVGLRQVDRQHRRLWPPTGFDRGRQFIQALLAPRHQHQIVAMPGKNVGKLAANSRRRAGDERDRRHTRMPLWAATR